MCAVVVLSLVLQQLLLCCALLWHALARNLVPLSWVTPLCSNSCSVARRHSATCHQHTLAALTAALAGAHSQTPHSCAYCGAQGRRMCMCSRANHTTRVSPYLEGAPQLPSGAAELPQPSEWDCKPILLSPGRQHQQQQQQRHAAAGSSSRTSPSSRDAQYAVRSVRCTLYVGGGYLYVPHVRSCTFTARNGLPVLLRGCCCISCLYGLTHVPKC